MVSTHIYAELLLNIKQVTVFITLPSNSNDNTTILLGPDQTHLHLRHEDDDYAVALPCQVVSNPALKNPPIPTKQLSFRLAVHDAASLPSRANSEVPWAATQLTPETRIACQSCGNLLVPNVSVWKDLPSGGWADMMDFWHCHKPDTDNDTSAGVTKGYAAANDLGPTAGVGLVDVAHVLLAESDCIGIQVRTL